jgi:hypothetical protein
MKTGFLDFVQACAVAELIVYRRPQRRFFEQKIAEITKGFTG